MMPWMDITAILAGAFTVGAVVLVYGAFCSGRW